MLLISLFFNMMSVVSTLVSTSKISFQQQCQHQFSTLASNISSQHQFPTLVPNISSQHQFPTLVPNISSQHLDVHNLTYAFKNITEKNQKNDHFEYLKNWLGINKTSYELFTAIICTAVTYHKCDKNVLIWFNLVKASQF